jgi:fused signal recognition particle receptor
MATEDAVFLGLLAFLVVAGVLFVLWFKRRTVVRQRPEAEAEELDERLEAPAEALPEAQEPTPMARPVPKPALKPTDLMAAGRTIQDGLEKTRKQGFVSRLAGLFRKEIDANIEQQIEEVLLTSDIGIKTAQKLMTSLKEKLDREQLRSADAVWGLLRSEVKGFLNATDEKAGLTLSEQKPWIIAVVGVNGTGKTTTIGKLAAKYAQHGRKVMLVAADTFRAAAENQLAVWAERAGADFHRGAEGQDPASVAFDGIRDGLEKGADVIIIDTAGRLHTQKNLVEELKKIVRVCGKAHEGAPHETLLVLDATTGQNAIQQANIFGSAVGVSGIVLTKLDGTAKGGVVIGICDQMQIPVKFVGVGEKVEDLLPFSSDAFLKGLFGDSVPSA